MDVDPEPALDPVDVPIPGGESDEELAVEHVETSPTPNKREVMEVSIEGRKGDINDNFLWFWGVIEDCFNVAPKSQQRKVEVNYRKLSMEDKGKFEVAMKNEWQSWTDNKVPSLRHSRGIPRERIIGARWVLVWKKFSDPDDRARAPQRPLVLVGWQDPELGRIKTHSPTLRKESKNLILSICAAKKWKIWGHKNSFSKRRSIG